jgi:hypothetical protein
VSAVLDPALDLALACHRRPALLAGVRTRALPGDLRLLLRLAAGDEALAAQCAASFGRTHTEVVEAAIFFIQQVLFAPDADSYRVLGVNTEAPDSLIKEHYRWLVRWQHPDRARDWDSVYADRINSAWQDVRLPERRRAYDDASGRRAAVGRPLDTQRLVPVATAGWHEPDDDLHRPVWFGRHLPSLVLGVLALSAVGLLALMWHARQPRHRTEVAAVAVAAPAIETPDAIVAAEAAARSGSALNAATLPADSAHIEGEGETPIPSPLLQGPLSPAPAVEPTLAPVHAPAPALAPAAARVSALTPAAQVEVPNGRSTAGAGNTAINSGPSEERVATGARQTAPAALPPSDVPPLPAPRPAATALPPIDQAAAEAVLRQFRDAYAAGNLQALMRLFTADAHNNRGDRAAIASDYEALFQTSQKRELELQTAGWIERGDERTLIARYHSRVRREGNWRATRVEGLIRIDLRRDDGVLKISRMVHDEDS